MLNKKVENLLNQQVNAEMYSGYLYLSMNSYFESKNLSGFANWMKVQAQEELSHAMKIYDYIIERGGTVTLTAIEAPKTQWQSITEVFEDTYAHEQKVTGLINDLVDSASEEKDHASVNFLQWFVDEQVEEEANASKLLEELKMIGEGGTALFMMDRELRQRVYTAPSSE
jgi:ferritin